MITGNLITVKWSASFNVDEHVYKWKISVLTTSGTHLVSSLEPSLVLNVHTATTNFARGHAVGGAPCSPVSSAITRISKQLDAVSLPTDAYGVSLQTLSVSSSGTVHAQASGQVGFLRIELIASRRTALRFKVVAIVLSQIGA